MIDTSCPAPALPLEILGHIVDFHATDAIDEDGRSSSSFRALLSSSLGLRDCALRVLCRDVTIDCGDPQRNRRLREVLIPQTTNYRLGTIAPYVKGVRMMLSRCAKAVELLDEISSLVDIISEESLLCSIVLDGVNREDLELGEYALSDPTTSWDGLPPVIIRSIYQFVQMSTVNTLKVYALSGLDQSLFQEEFTLKQAPIPQKYIRTTKITNHKFRSLDFKDCPMPFDIVLPNLKSITADNLNPLQLQNVWKISLHARDALEELEIDDEFYSDVPYFADTDNYEETRTIPPSICIDVYPKLKHFKYSHVLFDRNAMEAPTKFPQISFFGIRNPVPDLQSLSLAVRWGNVFSMELAAYSKEEAIARTADPAWSLLDSILTMRGCFPNLRYFDLTLSQDVQLSTAEFLLDSQGFPCSKQTADDLQTQIAESLRPSFCRLLNHSSISFKLDIVVTVEESV